MVQDSIVQELMGFQNKHGRGLCLYRRPAEKLWVILDALPERDKILAMGVKELTALACRVDR